MLQDWIHIKKRHPSLHFDFCPYINIFFWVSFTLQNSILSKQKRHFPPFLGKKKVVDLLTAPRGSVTFGTWAFLATGEASGNLGRCKGWGEEAEQNTPTPIRGGYFLGVMYFVFFSNKSGRCIRGMYRIPHSLHLCTGWCISSFFLGGKCQEDVSRGQSCWLNMSWRLLLKKRCTSPVDGIFLEFCNSIQLRYGVLLPNGSSCTDAITFFRRVRILQFLSICVLIYRHVVFVCLCAQIWVDIMSEK